MSPAPYAHPDFGYFCPSPGFRRKAWRVLAVIGLGVVAGSLVLRAGPRDDGALTVATATEAASGVEAMPAAEPAPAAPTAENPRADGGKTACAGHTWTYRNGKCIGARALRSLHAAIDRPPIAAIPLGHGAPPAPAASPAPVQPETAAQTAAATAPAATVLAATVPAATVPAATVPAKTAPAKTVLAVAAPVAIAPSASAPTTQSMPAAQESRQESRRESRKASPGRNSDRDPERFTGKPRDARARNEQRSARAHAAPDHRDREMSLPTSVARWARQLQDCIGAVRCRAGEQLLRAFLSPDI